MAEHLKDVLKRLPGTKALARRLGLATQSVWLFRRDVLAWTSNDNLVDQLPPPYRTYARYASGYFGRSRSEVLPGGHMAFRLASALHRAGRGQRLVRLRIAEIDVVVDLRDPRFLHVVNELSSYGEVACLEAFLRPGDTFVDIGANHGAFALVASRLVGEAGHVVAVEPQPWLAEAVEQSLTLTAPGSFEVHAIALGNSEGTIELLVPKAYSGTAGVFAEHSASHPHRRVSVPLRRFDDVVDWSQFRGSVFVKLDIEGSEYAFLQGAEAMIRTCHPTILMEINRDSLAAANTREEALICLLKDLGYRAYAEVDAPDQHFQLEAFDFDRFGGRNILLLNASAAAVS